jgi:hypothetical protein
MAGAQRCEPRARSGRPARPARSFELRRTSRMIVLGLRPSEGSWPESILSHSYGVRAFGGDPGFVGREMMLNGRPFEIVGVAVNAQGPDPYTGSHASCSRPGSASPTQRSSVVSRASLH